MIKVKELYQHKVIYDGEENAYYSHPIMLPLENHKTSLNVTNFKGVQNLENRIPKSEFQKIMTDIKANKLEHFDFYNTQIDNLGLYFTEIPESSSGNILIFVISKGETQPGRFKIFIEGLWLLTNG